MKFKHGLVTAGCLAAMGLAGTAQAVQVIGETLEIFGNLYPQYQVTNSADGALVGTIATAAGGPSNMTTGQTTPTTGAAGTVTPVKQQVNWVNSYVGAKGQKAFGDIRAGYELQAVVMANGTLATETAEIGAARDAYIFIAHKAAGKLQFGQMDTIYKEFGDPVRLLGTSSGNFTSTSTITSGVTWKSAMSTSAAGSATTMISAPGTTSFNTRINGQIRWISPEWSGVSIGASYRPDPLKTATTDASLMAAGIRWKNDKFYVGLAQEVHNDYRTVSGTSAVVGSTTGAPFTDVGSNIYSTGNPRSKDTATRLTLGYTGEKFRLGADISTLEYTEAATVTGNFSSYKTDAWQITGEYMLTPQITVGGNYGVNAAGSCQLFNTTTCTTNGLGGTLMSLGARYDYDKNIGVFALVGQTTVGAGAVLGGGNVGGNVSNMAIGVQLKF